MPPAIPPAKHEPEQAGDEGAVREDALRHGLDATERELARPAHAIAGNDEVQDGHEVDEAQQHHAAEPAVAVLDVIPSAADAALLVGLRGLLGCGGLHGRLRLRGGLLVGRGLRGSLLIRRRLSCGLGGRLRLSLRGCSRRRLRRGRGRGGSCNRLRARYRRCVRHRLRLRRLNGDMHGARRNSLRCRLDCARRLRQLFAAAEAHGIAFWIVFPTLWTDHLLFLYALRRYPSAFITLSAASVMDSPSTSTVTSAYRSYSGTRSS